eukprot:g61739.t1
MKHTVAAERESLSLALRSSENDYLSIEPQDVDVSATKYGGVWRRISEISEGWLVVTCGAITSVALLLILLSLLGVFAPRQTQTAVDPLKRLVNNREDRLPYDLTEGDWHNVDAAQDLLKIIEEERQHNTLSGKVLDKLDASDREKFQERHDLDVLFDPNKSLSDLDRDSVVQRLKEEAMSKKAGRLDGRGKKAAWNKYNSFKGKKGKAKGKRDDEDDDDGDEETGDDSVSPSASVSPSKSSETESGDLSLQQSSPSNSPAASSPSSPSSSSSSPSSSPSSSSSRSPSSSSSSSSSPSYSSSSSPSCSASSTRTPSSSVSLSPTASISVSPTSSRSPNPSLSPTSSRSPNPSLSPNSSPAAPVVVLVVDDFSSNPVQGEILDAAPPDQFVGLVQVGASLLDGTRMVTATKTGGAAGTSFSPTSTRPATANSDWKTTPQSRALRTVDRMAGPQGRHCNSIGDAAGGDDVQHSGDRLCLSWPAPPICLLVLWPRFPRPALP